MANPNSEAIGAAVLLAEQRTTARTSLSELLSREGYRVLAAPDSATSIELMTAHPEIRVILADLCMPDWLSILSHARTHLPQAAIIAMTGYDGVPQISSGKSPGIDHCFAKPLVFAEIKGTMERFLASGAILKR